MSAVIVDVDGVVAAFVPALLDQLSVYFEQPFREADIRVWDFIGEQLPADQRKAALRIMNEPSFWLGLPVIPGAREGVDALIAEGHHIVWATSPYYGCPSWITARLQWLKREFGHAIEAEGQNFEFHFSTFKHRIKADVIIDDKPVTIDRWAQNHSGLALRYSYPFNKDMPFVYRGCRPFTWANIDYLLEELRGEHEAYR